MSTRLDDTAHPERCAGDGLGLNVQDPAPEDLQQHVFSEKVEWEVLGCIVGMVAQQQDGAEQFTPPAAIPDRGAAKMHKTNKSESSLLFIFGP